ncbi:MAG: hypothetical protein QOJ11_562 [Frankiales bacterium]|jgi:hypothetical protein|nr:hypothetical protein [Frankiales bacterium]
MIEAAAHGWLGWDWGTVPAWFGAGSLLLAWYVIIRDRREKRRAQAVKVSAWLEQEIAEDNIVHLVVRNASDEPISSVRVFVLPNAMAEAMKEAWHYPIMQRRVMPPGPASETHPVAPNERVHLFFRDSFDRQWYRDPEGRLSRRTGEAVAKRPVALHEELSFRARDVIRWRPSR